MEKEQSIISMQAAGTLPEVFHERVLRTPHALAYRDFREGAWREHTWRQTQERVAGWQRAMLADGLQPGDRIAILCSNNWDWVICDQAAQGLGLVTVPVYTNDSSANVAWILKDSGASWLLVQSAAQWNALWDIHAQLAALRRVVTLEPVDTDLANVQWVEDWLPPAATEEEHGEPDLPQVLPDHLATIVYTSGTTGRPKGVMLTHRNILWNIHAALKAVKVFPDDVLLSFLPLSHALERTAGYYLPVVSGSCVAFSRGIPQLAEDLELVCPSLMISVPRIFERVYARIMAKVHNESPLKGLLFRKAVDIGWRRFEFRQGRSGWHPSLLLHPLLDRIVGSRIRAKLGGRLRFTVCGGASLNPEVARLFIGLGIPILQGYGLTETSPVVSANRLEDNLPSSVGGALPGVEVKLGENHELLTRSPSVMSGYWLNPEATQTLIEPDGWLHTGDKVSLDEQGHITITGRLKEIIVLANGEKVPPGDMENAIGLDNLVDQVMVIGEGRPYLAALVVPNADELERIMQPFHLDPANQAIYADKRVSQVLLEHIALRTAEFPGYARIRQVAVVPDPWTPDNGLLTPTLKLRRERILEECREEAEKLYAGH